MLEADAIRDQILMHLSNGFNGPSITAAWLMYVLATHPEVEEKVIAEIDSITGGDAGYDLAYDDLMRLSYTTQVIKETLRIYPPMPVTIRRSLKDGTLGRYRIRKGDIILVGTLAAQRDPRYWGPDADAFDPDQFAMDKVVGRPRHAFIPFSIGRRQCMAQEVTFMMLRVLLFEVLRRFQVRLAPGAAVTKNTVVTTKPTAVPIVRLPREQTGSRRPAVAPSRPVAPPPPRIAARDWGAPMEIPAESAYRHLVIGYGSNFGACKELAERFAERSAFYGYTSEVVTLNELAELPPREEPWLLTVMTSTYTSNPPTNATAFKTALEHARSGAAPWNTCKYLVWGLGNSQWNAFLAFPRYVDARLRELGAEPLADFAFGDVGFPVWERLHSEWNDQVWPTLLELSGARPTEAAAARVSAEQAAVGALTNADSKTAMAMSLDRPDTAPRVLLTPTILTNTIGVETVEARVASARPLHAAGAPKQARHVELMLPAGVTYRAGDHLGICPKNDEERVERLAQHLGAALDGLFMVPKTLNVRAVPKGVVLQTRNVLTNLVDIAGKPTPALVELLLEKVDGRLRAEHAGADSRGARDAGRVALGAALRDRRRWLRRRPAARRDRVLLAEHLRVPPGRAATAAPVLLAELEPARPRRCCPPDGRVGAGAGAGYRAGVPRHERALRALTARARPHERLPRGRRRFHLQDDVTKPMLFVSAGTGFAPMRAFLWERAALRSRRRRRSARQRCSTASNRQALDYIYRDEIEQFRRGRRARPRAGRDVARRAGARIRAGSSAAEGALVWRLLDAGGYVYVCGSQPMRAGVRDAFVEIAIEHGGMSSGRAEAWLDELESNQKRYRPDLWG